MPGPLSSAGPTYLKPQVDRVAAAVIGERVAAKGSFLLVQRHRRAIPAPTTRGDRASTARTIWAARSTRGGHPAETVTCR
eukprot:362200-Chlamydomonas_euryale.AAC.12